jgi:hypothetical protein
MVAAKVMKGYGCTIERRCARAQEPKLGALLRAVSDRLSYPSLGRPPDRVLADVHGALLRG